MAVASRSSGFGFEPALLVGVAVCVGVASVFLLGPMPGAHGGSSCSSPGCGSGGSSQNASSGGAGGGGGPQGQSLGISLTLLGWVILLVAGFAALGVAVTAVLRFRGSPGTSDSLDSVFPWLNEGGSPERRPRPGPLRRDRAPLPATSPTLLPNRPARERPARVREPAAGRRKVKPLHLLMIAAGIVVVAWLLLALLPSAETGVGCAGASCGAKPGHVLGKASGGGAGGGTGSGTGGGAGNGSGGSTGSGAGGGSGNGSSGGSGTGSGGGSGGGAGGGSGSGGGGSGNGTGGGSSGGSSGGSGNTSGGSSGGGGQNGTKNSTGGGSGGGTGGRNETGNTTGPGPGAPPSQSARLTLTVPVWAILGAVVLSAGAVAVWFTSRLLVRRNLVASERSPSAPGPSKGLAPGVADRRPLAAVREARAALGRAADPRSTILRLYGQLLAELESAVGNVACATAEEIRLGPLQRLGVEPPLAIVLTRLFETARYSRHPLGLEDAARFGDAFQAVERGLASKPTAG